jgi:hypothetical protein
MRKSLKRLKKDITRILFPCIELTSSPKKRPVFVQAASYNGAFRTGIRTPNAQQRGQAISLAALGLYITFWSLHARGLLRLVDPPADLISALELRVLGDHFFFFFAEAG